MWVTDSDAGMASFDDVRDGFQALGVSLGKVVELVAVDVENGKHLSVRVKYRHDDLRPRGRTAGDVARKRVNVRHDHGLSCRICMPANALIEAEARTRERALKRAEN